ncbi:hypothetical protein AEMCBJ_33875 (plasmid) [Cupriavidus necator]
MLHKPRTSVFATRQRRADSSHFSFVSHLPWRALRAQDGLFPYEANNSFLASTRFARPNRLNNCAVFLTRPL